MFALIYAATFIYIGIRLRMKWWIKRRLKRQLGIAASITLVPGFTGASWQFAADFGDCYRAGKIIGRQIHVESTVKKLPQSQHSTVVMAAIEADGV
jgi:inner membrane protein